MSGILLGMSSFLLRLFAVLLHELLQHSPRVQDMALEEFHGRGDISLAAKLEKFAMFALGAFEGLREIKLQARVAIAVVVEHLNDGHEIGTIGARIERGMELPIQASPGANLPFHPQSFLVGLEDLLGLLKILVRKIGNGKFQNLTFEKRANSEELFDLFPGEGGNNRAAMSHDFDEPFRFQLAQRFADGDAADLEIHGNGVLAELLSLLNLTADYHFAQFFGDGRCKREARDAFSRAASFRSSFRIHERLLGTTPISSGVKTFRFTV
jgi:hypothetical protein